VTNVVKVQINSLEAVERLIGGDSAIEIEIRNNVVDKFEKKYLKGLATESFARIKPWMEELKTSCVRQIEKEIGKIQAWGYSDKIELTSEFKKAIQEAVKKQIEVEVYLMLKQLWEDRKAEIMQDVQTILKKEVEVFAKKLVVDDAMLKDAVREGIANLLKKIGTT
jgi:hypothetical protein